MSTLNGAGKVHCNEPPHSWEIHVKRQQFILRTQLHHIPEKLIDLDVKPKSGLTLSTERFTKKYFLSIPFPKTITVDGSGQIEAILDRRGVLTVRIPLKRISAELVREHEERSKGQSAALKKKENPVSGEVQMRSKEILFEASGDSEFHSVQDDISHDEVSEEKADTRQKRHKKAPVVSDEELVTLSKTVADKTQKKIDERKKRAEELQRYRETMIEARKVRQDKKSDVIVQNFNKILEEKRTHLERMLVLQKRDQPSQSASRIGSTKRVTFQE